MIGKRSIVVLVFAGGIASPADHPPPEAPANLVRSLNERGTALQDAGHSDAAEDEFRSVLRIDPQNIYALDRLAQMLIDQKRYSAAIGYLNAAPDAPNLRLRLAVAYTRNGDPQSALPILRNLVATHPAMALAHFNLASVYAQLNRFSEAAAEYAETLRIEPANDLALVSRIKALISEADTKTALPIAIAYADRKPQDFEAVSLLGIIYRRLGRNAEAEKPLQVAVRLQPEDYDALYNLGFVLAHLDRPREALPHLEKALELRPDSSEAHYQLFRVLLALGRSDQAEKELRVFQQEKRATELDAIASVKANQASEYLKSGDVARAAQLYREALQVDPGNARTHYDLALALRQLNDHSGEHHELLRAVELDPQFALAQNQLGLLDLQENRTAEAEKHLLVALASDPQYAEASNNLGVLYARQGKAKEAEVRFRRAVEDNPKYADALANLGITLAGEGRFAEAEPSIQAGLALSPDNIAALAALGAVEGHLGHTDQTVQAFRRMVALRPNSAEAHWNLGIALTTASDKEGALAEFTAAVELAPNNAPAHYGRGRALFDLRRLDEARNELETAIRLQPQYPEAFYTLALLERQSGALERSCYWLKRLVTIEPQNRDAHFLLGQNLSSLGRTAEAITHWTKVYEIDPTNAEALYRLSRALRDTDPARARDYATRFRQLHEKREMTDRAETVANVGIGAAASGDWHKAASQLREAIEICGNCQSLAVLHKNLGLIYCRAGDMLNGKAELLIARKSLPDDPDIREALKIIETFFHTSK